MLLLDKIKMLRHREAYIQEDVAKLMDVSVPAYSKMETGVTDLNFSRIEQIAAIYKLTVVQLLDPDYDPFKKDDAMLLSALKEKLSKKDEQLSGLQTQLIALYKKLAL